jgi:mycothiol synthase
VTPAASELRFRAPVLTDADAVAAVVNQRELADRGSAEVTAAMIAARWSAREIELGADARLALADDDVVGYALVTHDREFVSVVPAFERRGIGSALLEWAITRSADRGVSAHRQIVGSANAAAAALLRGAGYERVRSHHWMQMTLTDPLPGDPPSTIKIRAIDPLRDARELHRVDAEAFADNVDSAPETFEQFRDEHLVARDAEASIVAVEDDRIVGYLLAERRDTDRLGYVCVLGVSPYARGRGVATALISTAVAVWLAAGVPRIGLTVASDNPRAKRLYERLGMTVRYTLDEFERPI